MNTIADKERFIKLFQNFGKAGLTQVLLWNNKRIKTSDAMKISEDKMWDNSESVAWNLL